MDKVFDGVMGKNLDGVFVHIVREAVQKLTLIDNVRWQFGH